MARVSLNFDDSALQAQLNALQEKLQETARPAAQAGAQVLYEEVRLRAPVSKQTHSTKGKRQTYQPGNLRSAIYQVYSKSNSNETKATYQVSYNQKKAFYGRFIEFGTVKSPARPFIRPSYDAKNVAALQTAKAKFLELAQKAINGA